VARAKSDLVMVAYLTVGAPVVAALVVTQLVRGTDGVFTGLAVFVALLGVVQSLSMGYTLLVRKPRAARERRYALTGDRLLIGSIRPDVPAASWYRDQLAPPRLARPRDGTTAIQLSWQKARVRSVGHEFLFSRPGGAMPGAVPVLSGIADPEPFLAALAWAEPEPVLGPFDPAVIPSSTEPIAGIPGWTPRVGERVLWTGRPARVPWWFGSGDLSQTLWAGTLPLFVIGMAVLVASHGGPPLFLVVCAVMFLGTFQGSFGRVLWRRARIARSTYVITDQRVLCLWDPRGLRTAEASHEQVLPPQIRRDGSVYFHRYGGAPVRRNSWPQLMYPAVLGEPPNFIGLAEPGTVAVIAARARAAAVAGASAVG
jgi:hypothetical protein